MLLLAASCNKEPDFIGLDLLPEGDRLNMSYIDTLDIEAYTIREDSLRTDGLAVNLIGYINDPTFGQVNASFYTQYRLASFGNKFIPTSVADSMVLYLVYAGLYGDSLSTQHLKVYELNEKLEADKAYYSGNSKTIAPSPIGEVTFVPSFVPDTVTKTARLRISLSNEFMLKFLAATDSTYTSNTKFLEVFKGLYLEADPSATTGTGSVVSFNLLHAESKLQLFFHNDTVKSQINFVINSDAIRFNHYEHDYSAAAGMLVDQLQGNTLAGEERLYIQAMAGTKVNLRIPYIQNIPGKEKMAINEALLVLTNADPLSAFLPPPQLAIRLYNDTGSYVILPEESINAFYFGGQYRKDGEYHFRITKYVQDRMMHPEKPDYGMVLLAAGSALIGNRVVLYGPGSETSALKLKIYYSQNGL